MPTAATRTGRLLTARSARFVPRKNAGARSATTTNSANSAIAGAASRFTPRLRLPVGPAVLPASRPSGRLLRRTEEVRRGTLKTVLKKSRHGPKVLFWVTENYYRPPSDRLWRV